MSQNNPTYLCRHCRKDVGIPKPFSMVVACPNCKLVTAASVALALGAQEKAKQALGMSHEQVQELAENAVKKVSGVTHTDCRTEDGITVQLVDTIINSARLLKNRDLMTPAAQDAIADMRHDEDVEKLMQGFEMDIRDRQRAEIKQLRKALTAMQGAFDIGQSATPTSAIGLARIALGLKP